ncbi:MAG: clostripain-related cysteine peptidase [Thermoplasmatota archaeon]
MERWAIVMAFSMAATVLFSALGSSTADPREMNDPLPSREGDEWLLLLYMAGDNDLGRDNSQWGNPLKMDINEMESSIPQDGVKVLALADFDGGQNTYLYNIEQDLSAEITSPTIPLMNINPLWTDEIDMSDWRTLRDFIIYSVTNHTANKTMMVIWDHGSGWYAANTVADVSISDVPPTRAFNYDNHDGGSMYLDEFRNAFIEAESSLGDLHMDIIGFDTCSMGMMEVFYQVSPWFDLAIGAEDEEPYYGYNYSFISKMGAPDLLDPEPLGKEIIQRFSTEYKSPGEYAYASISMVDLPALMSSLVPGLDELSRELFERMHHNELNEPHLFRALVGSTEDLTFTDVDLGDLLKRLVESELQVHIRLAASNVLDTYNLTVIDEWHKGDGRNPGATGISIYLPPKGVYLTVYDGSSGFLNFTKDTYWDEMIREYHNPVERVRVNLDDVASDPDMLMDDLQVTVTNPLYGLPIGGAEVHINGEQIGYCNEDGDLLVKDLSSGTYYVEAYNGTHVGEGTIRIMNRAPKAVIEPSNATVFEGEQIFLTAMNSTDPDGDKLVYSWDLDDSNGLNDTDSRSLWVELIFYESGPRTVRLTVNDSVYSDSVDLVIQVNNRIPSVKLSVPPIVMEDEVFTIDASATWDTVPDIEGLEFRYFLDGELLGDWSTETTAAASVSHAGAHTVSVEARDPEGAVGNASATVNVRNAPPRAVITGNASYLEGESVTLLGWNSTDTYSDMGTLNYTWHLEPAAKPVGYGKVLELVFYTPGERTVRLEVTDDDGEMSADEIVLKIVNQPPAANILGTITAEEDEVFTLSAYPSFDMPWDMEGLLYLWDVDGDKEVDFEGIEIDISYPTQGYKKVHLTVIDSDGGSSDAYHTVQIDNRPPRPVIEGEQLVMEDREVVYNATGGENGLDTPSDMVSLTYEWWLDDLAIGTDDRLVLVMTQEGEHVLKVKVTDDDMEYGSAEFSFNVTNPPPQVHLEDVPSSIEEGRTFTALGYRSADTPSDVDALSFQWYLDYELLEETGKNITIKAQGVGMHYLTLKVTDDEGAYKEVSVEFEVTEKPMLRKFMDRFISLTSLFILVIFLLALMFTVFRATAKTKELPQLEKVTSDAATQEDVQEEPPDVVEEITGPMEDETMELSGIDMGEIDPEGPAVPLPEELMKEYELPPPPEIEAPGEIPPFDEGLFERD